VVPGGPTPRPRLRWTLFTFPGRRWVCHAIVPAAATAARTTYRATGGHGLALSGDVSDGGNAARWHDHRRRMTRRRWGRLDIVSEPKRGLAAHEDSHPGRRTRRCVQRRDHRSPQSTGKLPVHQANAAKRKSGHDRKRRNPRVHSVTPVLERVQVARLPSPHSPQQGRPGHTSIAPPSRRTWRQLRDPSQNRFPPTSATAETNRTCGPGRAERAAPSCTARGADHGQPEWGAEHTGTRHARCEPGNPSWAKPGHHPEIGKTTAISRRCQGLRQLITEGMQITSSNGRRPESQIAGTVQPRTRETRQPSPVPHGPPERYGVSQMA